MAIKWSRLGLSQEGCGSPPSRPPLQLVIRRRKDRKSTTRRRGVWGWLMRIQWRDYRPWKLNNLGRRSIEEVVDLIHQGIGFSGPVRHVTPRGCSAISSVYLWLFVIMSTYICVNNGILMLVSVNMLQKHMLNKSMRLRCSLRRHGQALMVDQIGPWRSQYIFSNAYVIYKLL